MIKINLDGRNPSNFAGALARIWIAMKLESLGYVDCPDQLSVCVRRCDYVRRILEKRNIARFCGSLFCECKDFRG